MSVVYTIGHSKHPLPVFFSLLHGSGIQNLADIRSVPYSRFAPQFNQGRLRDSMAEEGIRYLFLGDELGGRINDAECYIDRSIPELKAGYARFLDYDAIRAKDWFNSGIAKLLELAETGATAIMCSEENPEGCHRELIVGRRLRELGLSVFHIRSKKAETGQIGLFA